MTRPSFDEVFMEVAKTVAKRSTCPRMQVGAVVVKNDQIVSTGYNGAPRGLPHCTEVGCLMENDHCVRVVHAEVNAILQAKETEGCTLYCTHMPCVRCSQIIINSGIQKVIIPLKEWYTDQSVKNLFWKSETLIQFLDCEQDRV